MKLLKIKKLLLLRTKKKNKSIVISKLTYGLMIDGESVLLHFEGTQILEVNKQAKLTLGHVKIDFPREPIVEKLNSQIRSNIHSINTAEYDIEKVNTVEDIEIGKASDLQVLAKKVTLREKSSFFIWILFGAVAVTALAFFVFVWMKMNSKTDKKSSKNKKKLKLLT